MDRDLQDFQDAEVDHRLHRWTRIRRIFRMQKWITDCTDEHRFVVLVNDMMLVTIQRKDAKRDSASLRFYASALKFLSLVDRYRFSVLLCLFAPLHLCVKSFLSTA
jgi:hypothetical protein